MIFGEFSGQTDEKGRIRIPARLKPFLGDALTITKGTNGCLFIFGAEQWHDDLAMKLTGVPMTDLGAQRSLRMFFSSANALEEDNQGRSLLPRNLREFAGLVKDIVFIGVGNRAELWAKERYDAYMAGKVEPTTVDFDKLFAELGKYGV